MSKSNTTWKFKIDPAFDKVIKGYVKHLLTPIGKSCKDGQIGFLDEYVDLALKSTGWHSIYISDKPIEENLKSIVESEEPESEFFQLFYYPYDDRDAYFDICSSIAEELPEKSRKYYLKQIESFKQDHELRPPFNMSEPPPDFHYRELYAVIGSLFMRIMFMAFDEVGDEETFGEEIFKRPEVVSGFMGHLNKWLLS